MLVEGATAVSGAAGLAVLGVVGVVDRRARKDMLGVVDGSSGIVEEVDDAAAGEVVDGSSGIVEEVDETGEDSVGGGPPSARRPSLPHAAASAATVIAPANIGRNGRTATAAIYEQVLAIGRRPAVVSRRVWALGGAGSSLAWAGHTKGLPI